MPNNPPANPLPGAVYVDQSTNITWVWTGTYWLQAYGGSQNYNQQQQPTTAIIPGYYAEPSPDSWFPSVGPTAPAYPSCGQIWVDNSVTPNYAQVWDCNTNAWIQLGGIPGGDTNSIVSVVAPTIRVSGDALQSGDFWLNPINDSISYWNGANWTQISTPDTHTIYSSLTPATRYNGDTLVPGDLWTDPDDNSLRYWNGVSWQPVVAIDNDHQLSATPPTLRPDGSGLLVADLYTNTGSGTLFYWDGAAWNRYNDTDSFHSTAAPTTRPDGSNLEGGDQWFNPTTDQLFVYDATTLNWVLVTTADTHSWWSATAPATRPGGTALENGDMWTDSTANLYGCHPLKVWNSASTSWICVGEKDTHSYLGTGVPAIVLRPDGSNLLDGDIYIDIASQQGYYYNTATSSWTLFGSDTHAWLGTGDPVTAAFNTRPNGTALVNGDIYIDTTSQQGYYYNTATSTWTLFGSDTHSFLGAGDPIIANPTTTRPNGTALQDGDQYIDTVSQQGYYYNTATSTWTLFGSDTHSFTGAGTPYIATPSVGTNTQSTRPNGTVLTAGDQYLDTNTNILYAYQGTEWVIISGDTHSFVGAGTPYIATPSVGTNTQTIRPDGSPLISGDIYIDSATQEGYYYNGSEWVPFGVDTHSFTSAGVPTLVTPYSAGNRPSGTALKAGDQYLDTNTKLLYAWDGAAWNLISGDTHSIAAAVAPTTRSDLSALKEGDQWVDTDFTPSIEYTYTGGAWRPNGDVTVVAALPAVGEFQNQLLVNSTTNRMYRWDTTAGPSWVQVA